jgi:thiol-disulfide isomerase/thioredoxin
MSAKSSKRRTALARSRAVAAPPTAPFIQRYRGWILAGIGVAVVVTAVIIFSLEFGPDSASKGSAAGNLPVDPAVVAAVTGMSPAIFDAVGVGSFSTGPKALSAPSLTRDGKPELLYVGAEYCPFCAAERWALVVALSRFGSFTNLHLSRSSATDVFPNTPTFTFFGAQYSSPYVTFTPVEQTTNQPNGRGGYTPLQSLGASQQAVFVTYDKPPYVPSAGSIPFIDFGGKYVLAGATFDPGLLAHKEWSQIAARLDSPSTVEAKAIAGSANLLTAAICGMTGQQPATVCASAGVTQAAQVLGK